MKISKNSYYLDSVVKNKKYATPACTHVYRFAYLSIVVNVFYLLVFDLSLT